MRNGNPVAIPDGLKSLPQFVLYREKERDGRTTKVPYHSDGSYASTTDPESWMDFQQASEALRQGGFDGLGFVFTKDDDYVGIDLDACIRDGTITDGARKFVTYIDSYTEVSPSGTGLHIICKGNFAESGRRTKDLEGVKVLEIYRESRYFTMTGDHLEDTPRETKVRSDQLAQIYNRFFASEHDPGTSSNQDISDDQLIEKIRNSKQAEKFFELWSGDTSGYPSHSEADLALARILAFWTGGDHMQIDRLFRRSGLYREKWERDDYRDRTITKAVQGQDEFYIPSNGEAQGGQEHPSDISGSSSSYHEAATSTSHSAGRRPDHPRPLPDDVYANLPPLLEESTSALGRQYEKDVYLTGALGCISSCLPNVKGYYGSTTARPLGPGLYTAIVAGAAGGKGVLTRSRDLTVRVNQKIVDEYEQELEEWSEKDGDERDDDPPPERSLFLPANTSAAAFHNGLKNRGERALVFETEIDTLMNALEQEWGKFDDTLRKAWHHERTSYRRRSEGGNVVLRSPHISVVLSGTPHQFRRLIGSTESGLYSRFLLYYFDAPPVWISQEPDPAAIKESSRFRDDYSKRVLNIWERLRKRRSELRFKMKKGQWRKHDEAFRGLLSELRFYEREDLADVVKRAGVVAFRVAMVCRILRAYSKNSAALSRADTLEASDADVHLGIELATSWAKHSIWFATQYLDSGVPPSPRARRIGIILDAVEGLFASRDAYEAAEKAGLDVSERTLRSDLNHANKLGLIEPGDKRSLWIKAD
jgi:hypothetical protein